MMQIGTITSQGQITIPAKFRKAMKLKKNSRVILKLEADKIMIQPSVDLLALSGCLSKYAKKSRNINEVMKAEKEAIKDMYLHRYKKFLKNE